MRNPWYIAYFYFRRQGMIPHPLTAALALLLVATILLSCSTASTSAGPPAIAQDQASSASLSPIKDNTLYQSVSGSLSNGAGDHFFAGRNNRSEIRRGVIAFDIAGNVPAGSTITSVSLTLNMSRTHFSVGARTVSLHKLLADWGEGTSNAGGNEGAGVSSTVSDATWVHTFFNTATWGTAGGDFSATVSASASVGGNGGYTWGSTAQMVADVQGWLDDPSSSFGWLLRGDEGQRSTKRFDTRENSAAGNRPMLTIEFTPPPPPVLEFSAAVYNVPETGGNATITVTHTGGSASRVTVDYATSVGSATAGSDYTSVSGTLTFATGDTGDKIFNIPIIDDFIVEGDETVNLALSNPTGGAMLGSSDTAVLVIAANDTAVDVNEDGFVDSLDLRVVVANFGPRSFGNPRADVNGDGVMDICDLALVARNLGRLAPQPLQAMRVERAFPNLTFQSLTNLAQPDDERNHMFATEQAGRIRVFPNDQAATRAGTFLDIGGRVSQGDNEEGLLGLAFDPGYRNNGYFYVYYSAATPRRSVVSRFSVSQNNPNVADSQSEFVIMEIPQPFGNHNGGQLAFGPDGYLYVGLGDGGSSGDPDGNGQNTSTLLGSMLRIDVSGTSGGKNYRIPPDNPFVGSGGAQEEIWAYGLRNPWRFSFDAHTGTLWMGDVGQNKWEEIDVVERGLNYGWKIMEGLHCFSPGAGCDQTALKLPVAEYGHSDGCSVTGGYVYRGRGIPSLLGAYVYADFCSGKIWGLRYDGGFVTERMLLVDSDLFIASFGQDASRNLYILSRNDGIYRLVPAE